MKITYEAILENPALLDEIEAAARRERARAVQSLIVQPIKVFLAEHAPRPHLARQG